MFQCYQTFSADTCKIVRALVYAKQSARDVRTRRKQPLYRSIPFRMAVETELGKQHNLMEGLIYSNCVSNRIDAKNLTC